MTMGPRFGSILASAERTHTPVSVSFEITLKCNLRCAHCYNFDRDQAPPSGDSRGELDASEIRRILREVRAEGALFLTFTGGEPTTHPSLDDFVALASDEGMFVRLKSNGTLFRPDRLDDLARAGLKAVDVSVYGTSAATHDAFVRHGGSFERTVSGIRAAKKAGLAVRLSFVLSGANLDEVAAMPECAANLGVAYNMDTHLTARHDGTRSPLDFALDRRALDGLYRGPLARFAAGRPEGGSIACPCARSVCGISAVGEVYPCIGAPLPAGNLRSASFQEIWRSSPTLRWVRSLRNEDFTACASCPHARYCRRTSGVMLNNTGRFDGPPRFGDDLCCAEAQVIHEIVDEKAVADRSAPGV